MKTLSSIILLLTFASCASKSFVKENVCSNSSIKYLSNPKNKSKRAPMSLGLNKELKNTQDGMQLCYEDFKRRTGKEEFQTCLVVGVDNRGKTEYFDFYSREIPMDWKFRKCAMAVTKRVPFRKYGKNYIMVQSYNFYNSL